MINFFTSIQTNNFSSIIITCSFFPLFISSLVLLLRTADIFADVNALNQHMNAYTNDDYIFNFVSYIFFDSNA